MTDLAITSAIASNYQGMIAMVGADHRVYLGKPENCYLSPEGDAPAYGDYDGYLRYLRGDRPIYDERYWRHGLCRGDGPPGDGGHH